MKRVSMQERGRWRDLALQLGFFHHTTANGPYWCDEACYLFSEQEIMRDLRPAIREVWDMCLVVVERASRDDEILASLRIPEAAWDGLRDSWIRGSPTLCTRFDFAYHEGAPPKLHECNGDIPGALFETAVFQWIWLEDRRTDGTLAPHCDQFNRLHDALIETFVRLPAGLIHVTAASDNVEDQVWARYVQDCAIQAHHRTQLVALEAIGHDVAGALTDEDDRVITRLAKAYRWELLLREPFGPLLLTPAAPCMIEPLWKLVLASKGMLVWLWRLFPDHPNLLPCWFQGDPAAELGDRHVIKPLFSIKGHNVRLADPSLPGGGLSTPGPYGSEGRVIQALHRLPCFARPGGESHASIGGWIVGNQAEGISILESDGPIIYDPTSRFAPHAVMP